MRLYLGEIASLVLATAFIFGGAAVVSRYFPSTRVRMIRNLILGIVVAIFAGFLASSLVVNQTPRGRIDRTAADQDQKQFEIRHAAKEGAK